MPSPSVSYAAPVPRNRPHLDRDEKVEQILAAAEERLVSGGLAALSVADIARQLGLAQNAVYWYFPAKDDLLVATCHRIIDKVMARKPRGNHPIDKVLWFAERLAEFAPLRVALHERAATSKVIAAFEADVATGLHMLLAGVLASSVPADRVDVTVAAVIALVEGTFLGNYSRKERADVVRFGFEQLTRP
jgi:TetR/AcrR family transcriptional regulator of autoinduction and epiphytic fitness